MAIEINIEGKSIIELRNQLKGLKNDLSAATDPVEMARLAEAAGKVKDKMSDINEQVAVFSAGSKFEQAGIALGQIGTDLGNLDFEGAAEKAAKLTQIVKGISFGEATKGLSQLGSTFLNLGKALLTNPLFLIPAAITAILGALGLLGPIIDGVMAAFKFLGDAVNEFLVSLGLVQPAIKEVSDEEKKAAEAAEAHADSIAKEVTGFKLLITQLSDTNAGSKERGELIKKINEQYGTTLKNIKDEDKFQAQLNTTVENYLKFVKQRILLQSYEVEYAKNLRSRIQLEEKLATLQEEKDSVEKTNKRAEALRDEAHRYRDLWKEQDQSTSSGRKLAKSYKDQEVALNDRARAMEANVVSTVAIDFEMKSLTESLEDNIKKEKELDKKYLEGTKTLNSFNIVVDKTTTGTKGAGKEVEKTTEKFEKLSLKLRDVNGEFKNVEKQTPILISGLSTMYSEMFRLAEKDKQAMLKINSDTLQGKLDILQDQKEKELQNKDLTEKEKLEIEKRYKKLSDELTDEDNAKKREKTINSILALEQAGADVIAAFGSMKQDSLDREKDALDEKHKAELAGLEEGSAAYTAAKERQAKENDDVARRAFEANKRSQLGAAIMNAAMGITSIIAQYPKFDGGIAMAAALISTAAINTAAIAKIASTQYKSASSGSSGVSANNVTSTPSYNLFGNNNNQNTTNASMQQQVNVNNQVTVKAVVSETEITDAQEKVARYRNSATL